MNGFSDSDSKYAGSFYEETDLKELAARRLKLPPQTVSGVVILRQAVDARRYHGAPIQFVYMLDVCVNVSEKRVLNALRRDRNVGLSDEPLPSAWPDRGACSRTDGKRPIVVGFGPAGMFAALTLARAGLQPLVLERGRDVDSRQRDIARFWQGGALDVRSNVQFGEGGAGTFSDGKLTTRISDPHTRDVLEAFVRAGAPAEIRFCRNRILVPIFCAA